MASKSKRIRKCDKTLPEAVKGIAESPAGDIGKDDPLDSIIRSAASLGSARVRDWLVAILERGERVEFGIFANVEGGNRQCGR